MKILGIHEGHNATASLMIDGEIVAAANEERFTRKKNEAGYPQKAIEYCLKEAKISPDQLDLIALVGLNVNLVWSKIKRESSFKIEDWVFEQQHYFKPLLIEKKDPAETLWNYLQQVEARKGIQETPYDFTNLKKDTLFNFDFKKARVDAVVNHLKVNPNKIQFVNHHQCHRYYAYYASPFREDTLILTVDGEGDGANATVAIVKDGKITTVHVGNNCQIARIYRYITLMLGMKPLEHEYKVMGLAPYANSKETDRAYTVFSEILEVDGLDFKWKNKPQDLYFHFVKKLEGCRFDGIAGALQKFTEELILTWARNAIRQFGIKTVVFSGGVAMNIKLNLRLAQLPEIENFFVSATPSDESNCLGACYVLMEEYCRAQGLSTSLIKPLTHAYLGPSHSGEEIKEFLKQKNKGGKFILEENVTNRKLAQYLVNGKIIGLCRGRMEFGARALGNRSILADPSNPEIISKINSQIKFRDFWMPFTPSLLEERASDYIQNPKNLDSPFMTLGFESTGLGKKELIAALHPADLTARPQIVKKNINPDYYDVIKEFENLTGIGGVLNTSLNLHGLPIVNGPADALEVMENSELDMLCFGNFLIRRS